MVEKDLNLHRACSRTGTRTTTSRGRTAKISTCSAARICATRHRAAFRPRPRGLVQNLLTEDNLPAPPREIADQLLMACPWGYWVNRWTAEENRHGSPFARCPPLLHLQPSTPVELEEDGHLKRDTPAPRARTSRVPVTSSPRACSTRRSTSASRSWPPAPSALQHREWPPRSRMSPRSTRRPHLPQ